MADLLKFLKAERNSLTREVLLRHRFIYDVCLAAARHGYALQVFLGEVDREGFDLVLDDADRVRKVQLKSVIGGTSRWKVQKNLLRPEPPDVEKLGLVPEPTSSGIGGVVVLQVVNITDQKLDVSYEFTDFAIISALASGVLRKGSGVKPTAKALPRLIEEVVSGPRTEKVLVPRAAFISVRSPGHLLGALGLHSPDVNCGDLFEVVSRALTAVRAGNDDGSSSHLREELLAISADFES